MVVKKIPGMGKIIFDEFYSEKNIIISNMNTSPIRNSTYLETVKEKRLQKLINNSYIYCLLKKRRMYRLYSCNPEQLLSHYRYDIYVKYFYVKSYFEDKNYALAKNIYLSHIKAFNNFLEPDGSKKNQEDFIKSFNNLIDSINENGFLDSVIPISKTGIPIDGAHRLAICLYFNIQIPFVVFDLLDGKYDRDFFLKRGMNEEYMNIIDELITDKEWL